MQIARQTKLLSPSKNRLTLPFYIGCAVWAYQDWIGNFYPSGSRGADFLQLYSQRLTAVEGNTTFYSTPEPKTVQRWATKTAEPFRFCPKLPRSVTHDGPLVPHLQTAQQFSHLMQGLGPKLGPIFAQLPPRYSPRSWSDLAEFLEAWSGARLALEVRHLDWFKPPDALRLDALLKRLDIGRVLLDTRAIYTWQRPAEDPQARSQRKKPRVPLIPTATTDFVLVRYISHPQLEQNYPFLQEWVGHVAQWLREGRTVYFFVHCPEEVHSPTIARYFQEQLEKAGVDVPPLPWSQIAPPPQQLGLF